MDIFEFIFKNDISNVYYLLLNKLINVNEKNRNGLTPLHYCATYGYIELAVLLLEFGADCNIKDIENGWTPLHRSIYFKHFKITWLLIKYGSKLDDCFDSKISNKSFDCKDYEGLSPYQLLSLTLSTNKKNSSFKIQTNIYVFGKADYQLGVALPKAMSDVSYPKRIHSLGNESIVGIYANKYHSICVTSSGNIHSWGHGRNGRLGHSDELTHPEPLQIQIKMIIIQISAGLNHTLALTSTNDILSWGSDSCGQLGHGSNDYKPIFSPKRIDSLKKEKVIGISAGESHSICCTDNAGIYTWGSNKVGQLGIPSSEINHTPSGNPGSNLPKKVFLTSNRTKGSHNYKIIQVVASYSMSIALINIRGIPINEVCQWGNGISLPTKVKFPINSNNEINGITICKSPSINIIQISGGKYHSVGVSDLGQVYTWGLGSELTGHGNSNNVSSHYTLPRLVEALLPQNIGGKVIHVNATSNRTCAITNLGDLYTWGATDLQGILGHSSKSNYQPIPKRVNGIKRAKQVALGEDHTLVLTTCLLPSYPLDNFISSITPITINTENNDDDNILDTSFEMDDNNIDLFVNANEVMKPLEIPTLKQLCERKLALLADIKAIPYLYYISETYNAPLLNQFCKEFIDLNLDAILVHAKPNDLDVLIEDYTLSNIIRDITSNYSTIKTINTFNQSLYNLNSPTISSSKTENLNDFIDNTKNYETSIDVNKLIKSIKKKLISIEELQQKLNNNTKEKITIEQKLKLDRKEILQDELKKLEIIYNRLVIEENQLSSNKITKVLNNSNNFDMNHNNNNVTNIVKDNKVEELLIIKDDFEKVENKLDNTKDNSIDDTVKDLNVDPAINNELNSKVDQNIYNKTNKISHERKSKSKNKKFIPIDNYIQKATEETAIPISTVGLNGRTVLSPPIEIQSSMPIKSSITISPWKTVPKSNVNVTSIPLIPEVTCNSSPLISNKKIINQSTKVIDNNSPNNNNKKNWMISNDNIKSEGYSLVSFLTPNKQIEIIQNKIISPVINTTPMNVTPSKSWNVPKSDEKVINSTMKINKSLIDIQKEEEISKQTSSMNTYGKSDNPWYIERKPRALSIDEVMKVQENEKIQLENDIKLIEIYENTNNKRKEIKKKNRKNNIKIN